MAVSAPASVISRRRLLLAAAGACCVAPLAAGAAPIYTPHEIAEAFAQHVKHRMRLPAEESYLYAGMAELQLVSSQRYLLEPQYVLVVDANPNVQAALLMWRLSPGSWRLLGAAPVSTGGAVQPDSFETPQGVYQQEGARTDGVYDFGWHRARKAAGRGRLEPVRLQARAADRDAERRLGTACSNGTIVLPSCLMAFIDGFALLDPQAARPDIPCRGRHVLVIDSERDRPDWAYSGAVTPAV